MAAILPDLAMMARAECVALEILAQPETKQAQAGLYAVVAYREILVEEFPGQPRELIDRTARVFASALAKKLEAIGLSGGSSVGNA